MVRQIRHRRRFPRRRNGLRRKGTYQAGSRKKDVLIRTRKTVYDAATKAKNIVNIALEGTSVYDSYVENDHEIRDKLFQFVLRTAIRQHQPILASKILLDLLNDRDFVYALKNMETEVLIRRFGSRTAYTTIGLG
jgi:hypothetical protein